MSDNESPQKQPAKSCCELAPCSQEEWAMILDLAVDLRGLIWDDANDMTQGAMVGCPTECIAFAKWWIQRAKGLPTDVPGGYPVFRENATGEPPTWPAPEEPAAN